MSPCDSRTIWWDDGLWLIDQTKLPGKLEPIRIESVRQLVEAIQSLRVRGAPALGAAGAYGIALAAEKSFASNAYDMISELELAAEMIRGLAAYRHQPILGCRQSLEGCGVTG